MSGAKPDKDNGIVARAAGFVVLGGVAWSLYKSVGPLILDSKKRIIKSSRGGKSYDILKGDTLFSISQRNGVSVEALKSANGLVEDDIYAGDTIIIPK